MFKFMCLSKITDCYSSTDTHACISKVGTYTVHYYIMHNMHKLIVCA